MVLPRHDDVFRFIGEDVRGGPVPIVIPVDVGSAKTLINRSDMVNVRRYRDRTTGVPRQGNYAALWVGSTTGYAEFPYRAESAARGGSGNTVTTGDFIIRGSVYFPSAVGGVTYPISVQDSTPTAAGTAWGFQVSATGFVSFVYSDGTTRRLLTAKTATCTAAGWYEFSAERFGSRIYLACSTANSRTVTVLAEATFTAALNVPSGGVIRFHNSVSGSAGIGGTYYDGWQIKRHSLFGGGHYSAPVDPVPFTAGTPGPAVDPFFANVKLLIDLATSSGHGIADLANSPATLTNTGSVTIGTGAGDPFSDGLGSAPFATNQYIATNRAPGIAAGDFTIEAFVRRTATSGVVGRIVNAQSGLNPYVSTYTNGSDKFVGQLRDLGGASSLVLTGTITLPLNTWVHVAYGRRGTSMATWVGGVLDATGGFSGNCTGAPNYEIGNNSGSASTQFFPGNLRGVRVTEGVCRFDPAASFVPPVAFYPFAA